MITLNEMKAILVEDNMIKGQRDEYVSYATSCGRIEIVVMKVHDEDSSFEFGCYYDGIWWEEAEYEDDGFSANELVFELLHTLY